MPKLSEMPDDQRVRWVNGPDGFKRRDANTCQYVGLELSPEVDDASALGATAAQWSEVWSHSTYSDKLYIAERAAADDDILTRGQLWVKDTNPCMLYFTDDVGNDYRLGGGAGDVSASPTPVDNQLAVWTDATTIEGDAGLTFDGSKLFTAAIGTTSGNLNLSAAGGTIEMANDVACATILTVFGDLTFNPQGGTVISSEASISGHAAIGAGATIDTGSPLYGSGTYSNILSIGDTVTDMSADYVIGIGYYIKLDPSAAPAVGNVAFGNTIEIETETGNAETFPQITGSFASVYHYGDGTVGYMAAVEGIAVVTSGDCTDLYGGTFESYGGVNNYGAYTNVDKNNVQPSGVGILAAGYFKAANTLASAAGTDTTYGVYTSLTRTGATGGTVNSYGYYLDIASLDNAGAGTHTAYGMYLESVTGADTNWAIYSAGGDSSFAGDVKSATSFTTPRVETTIGDLTLAPVGSVVISASVALASAEVLFVDTITEATSLSGVTIEGVKIEDGEIATAAGDLTLAPADQIVFAKPLQPDAATSKPFLADSVGGVAMLVEGAAASSTLLLTLGDTAAAGNDTRLVVDDSTLQVAITPELEVPLITTASGDLALEPTGEVTSTKSITTTNIIAPKSVCMISHASDDAVAVADGTIPFTIPADLNGYDLTSATASVYTKGVTDFTTVMVRKSRAGADVDMLSPGITIADEWFASDGTPITADDADAVQTGDQIYIDVDTIHVTPPNGLSTVLTFTKP